MNELSIEKYPVEHRSDPSDLDKIISTHRTENSTNDSRLNSPLLIGSFTNDRREHSHSRDTPTAITSAVSSNDASDVSSVSTLNSSNASLSSSETASYLSSGTASTAASQTSMGDQSLSKKKYRSHKKPPKIIIRKPSNHSLSSIDNSSWRPKKSLSAHHLSPIQRRTRKKRKSKRNHNRNAA
jgi:hypothetical protein